MEDRTFSALHTLVAETVDRSTAANRIAEWIAAERHYRWVGLYEVTPTEIAMIGCTGATPPAFPRFPISQGLCGAAVASHSIVNVGNVQEDLRWLTTFGTTRSEIIAPVFGNDSRVVGLIDLKSEVLHAFRKEDEHFLERSAAQFVPIFV